MGVIMNNRDSRTFEIDGPRVKFERLYRQYLATKLAINDPDAPADDADLTLKLRQHDAAERALLAEPAPIVWGVWRKWEVLESLIGEEAGVGKTEDNRVSFALGALKADILRFGICDPYDRP